MFEVIWNDSCFYYLKKLGRKERMNMIRNANGEIMRNANNEVMSSSRYRYNANSEIMLDYGCSYEPQCEINGRCDGCGQCDDDYEDEDDDEDIELRSDAWYDDKDEDWDEDEDEDIVRFNDDGILILEGYND